MEERYKTEYSPIFWYRRRIRKVLQDLGVDFTEDRSLFRPKFEFALTIGEFVAFTSELAEMRSKRYPVVE